MANKPFLTTLRRRSDFQHLFEDGQRVYPNAWMIVNYAPNNLGHLRCGWTIPRFVGHAVLRNRFKRWCREYFRNEEFGEWLQNYDLNVVLRRREKDFYKGLTHDEFRNSLDRAVRLMARKKTEPQRKSH